MTTKRQHSPSDEIPTKKIKRSNIDLNFRALDKELLTQSNIKIPLKKFKRSYSDLHTLNKKQFYSTNRKLKKNYSDSKLQNLNKESSYHEISHHEGRIKRFSTAYFVTEFILKNAISFPEDKLKEIFDDLIDIAYSKSKAFGKQVRLKILQKFSL